MGRGQQVTMQEHGVPTGTKWIEEGKGKVLEMKHWEGSSYLQNLKAPFHFACTE